MDNPNNGSPLTGFTENDRKVLTQIEVRLEYIVQSLADQRSRLSLLEGDHVSKAEMEDVRHLKADRTELSRATVADHDVRLRALEGRESSCPLEARLVVLENDRLVRDAKREEAETWQTRLLAVAKVLIPTLVGLLLGRTWGDVFKMVSK